ncbi:MAG: type III secretion T3S chaperone [Simkaniaceae bacterium]|nr:type III secretion T3S chaperone [Simkaniaceae bacterium]
MKDEYPLHQVVEIKQKRLDEAERVLKQKRQELENEETKLRTREEELETSKAHYDEKIKQLRDELDAGTTSDKIDQMKNYLHIVEDDLKLRKKKVKEQQELVIKAQEAVEIARLDMLQKQRDIEKLSIHKGEWEKEESKEALRQEAIEQDEIGTIRHVRKKRENKK